MNRSQKFSSQAKITAGVVALFTAATLLLRLWLSTNELGGVGAAALELSRFFTILTNILVMLVMARIALSNDAISTPVVGAVTMSIVGVGIVYHALLASQWDPQGWELVADHGLHTVVPAAAFIWWCAFANAAPLNYVDPAKWVLWPLIYSTYTLVRSGFSGEYPYFFLDAANLGYAQVFINLIGLSLVFYCLGALLLALRKAILKRS